MWNEEESKLKNLVIMKMSVHHPPTIENEITRREENIENENEENCGKVDTVKTNADLKYSSQNTTECLSPNNNVNVSNYEKDYENQMNYSIINNSEFCADSENSDFFDTEERNVINTGRITDDDGFDVVKITKNKSKRNMFLGDSSESSNEEKRGTRTKIVKCTFKGGKQKKSLHTSDYNDTKTEIQKEYDFEISQIGRNDIVPSDLDEENKYQHQENVKNGKRKISSSSEECNLSNAQESRKSDFEGELQPKRNKKKKKHCAKAKKTEPVELETKKTKKEEKKVSNNSDHLNKSDLEHESKQKRRKIKRKRSSTVKDSAFEDSESENEKKESSNSEDSNQSDSMAESKKKRTKKKRKARKKENRKTKPDYCEEVGYSAWRKNPLR